LGGILAGIRPGEAFLKRLLAALHDFSNAKPAEDDIAAIALMKGS